MKAFFAEVKFVLNEMKDKMTVWVALLAAALNELANNADTIAAQIPVLKQVLPQTPFAVTMVHALVTALAVLAAFARIRRAWVARVTS